MFGLVAGLSCSLVSLAQAVEIKEVTSPGGIHALLVEDYTNPLIAMRFAFKGAGSTQDAPGKEGTANLLSGLLDEGAGDIDSAAFQASSTSSASRSRSIPATTTSPATSAPSSRTRTRPSTSCALRSTSRASTRSRSSASAASFSPASWPTSRTRHAGGQGLPLDRLPRPSLRAPLGRHGRHAEDRDRRRPAGLPPEDIRRDNLVVGVVGAIDEATLKTRLDEIFLPLREKADLVRCRHPAGDGQQENVALNLPQTQIQFALPGVKRDAPEFFAAYLANHILGGGTFDSRLYKEIREKRGLAYGAGSYLTNYDHAAMLAGSTATRADKAQESIAIIRAELKRLADEGPSQEELDRAKAFVKGSYAVQNLSSSLSIASTLVGIQLDDLGTDYIERRQGLIDAVTLDQVKAEARRLLSVDPTIITVGPADA